MALLRFPESDTKRAAYGLTLLWVALVIAGSVLDPIFLLAAAFIGLAAGLCMGRLTEARERANGSGVILGKQS